MDINGEEVEVFTSSHLYKQGLKYLDGKNVSTEAVIREEENGSKGSLL